MRRGVGVFGLAVTAALAVAPLHAPAQDDARYWPLREINFPVPVDKIQALSPRPTKLRFYAAPARGKWELVAERAPNDLEVIDRDKNLRGFRYETPADGEYDFALQFVFANGDEKPARSDLSANHRCVVDSRPPAVKVAAIGATGVEWDVIDDNPSSDGVEVQVRYVGQTKWVTIRPRAFASRDRYSWVRSEMKGPLEVRIIARDRAGHDGVSQIVTLPTTGGDGGGLGDPPARGTGTGRTGFGNPEEFAPQPQIDYVNTMKLTVESRLTKVTRSGVKAAHLWVNDGKAGWKFDKEHTAQIAPGAADASIRIPHEVKADGLYGFIVIPVNGAGGKNDDPRRDDPAQFLIEVDTTKPVVEVTRHKVSPGGSIGPRVEIEWKASDKNLMPEPIVLEYSDQKTGAEWKPIHQGKLANTGRYVWEVEDKNLWRFYVRVRATDKASNAGEHIYDKEVLIDLEKPAAVIDKVQGSGGSSPSRDSERRFPEPKGPALPDSGTPPVPKLPDTGK